MGSVPNVGLMAQKAEEYGSHDKTFEIAEAGRAGRTAPARCSWSTRSRPATSGGRARPRTPHPGLGQARGHRARSSQTPAVFWLDLERAHDLTLIEKVDLPGRARHGGARIIRWRLRLGEAEVPRLGDGQRPARLQHRPVPDPRARDQRQDALGRAAHERRWPLRDRRRGLCAEARAAARLRELPALGQLGEFLALAESLRHIPTTDNPRSVFADTLDRATERLLNENKSPARKVGQIDNRGSHYYLALYWASELAQQSEDAELAAAFAPRRVPAEQRGRSRPGADRRAGPPADIGGYYRPDADKASAVMRPSKTFNEALATLRTDA